jgi:hypothetical protein
MYTSVTRNDIFNILKKDLKLHQHSVYATVDAIGGCIKYGWLLEAQGVYYFRCFHTIDTLS